MNWKTDRLTHAYKIIVKLYIDSDYYLISNYFYFLTIHQVYTCYSYQFRIVIII